MLKRTFVPGTGMNLIPRLFMKGFSLDALLVAIDDPTWV
jgi:hypothetical protein